MNRPHLTLVLLLLTSASTAAENENADYEGAINAFRQGENATLIEKARAGLKLCDPGRNPSPLTLRRCGEFHYLLGTALLKVAQGSHGADRHRDAKESLHQLDESYKKADDLKQLDARLHLTTSQNDERETARSEAKQIVNGERVLTIKRQGPGHITSDKRDIACGAGCTSADREFPLGNRVTLRAEPDGDAVFTRWEGPCVGQVSAAGTCIVELTKDREVTSYFVARVRLTVHLLGGGGGAVRSSPAGINCGQACAATFDPDAKVLLTPLPYRGASFIRWSPDCPDKGPCEVKLTGDKEIKARFRPVWAQPWLWCTMAAVAASALTVGLLLHTHPWDPDPPVVD